jgi:hypothetical protein
MTEFANYTKILLSALLSNPRAQDVIAKKIEILQSVYDFHNIAPVSTLFIGFNPAILATKGKVSVTAVDKTVTDYLTAQNIQYTYVDYNSLAADRYNKAFDSVVGFDEFFTFADSDLAQQEAIATICAVTNQVVISTVKDYKNQDFKDKEFSIPALIRNSGQNKIFLEFHDWSLKDRSSWNTTSYEIDNPATGTVVHGPFARRTMYFKQLAKFSTDAGAVHFQVHKNLMYKSLIKKNYEHVISIIFE